MEQSTNRNALTTTTTTTQPQLSQEQLNQQNDNNNKNNNKIWKKKHQFKVNNNSNRRLEITTTPITDIIQRQFTIGILVIRKGIILLIHLLNFPTTCIHGDLTQPERENALHSFRSFSTPFLVATDIASRGLHIGNVNLGLAISFFNEKNKPVGLELLKLMKASNQDIPDWFEKMVHNLRMLKGGPTSSKSNSPFNKSYNSHHNRDDNRGGYGSGGVYSNNRNDRREEKSDYSMHHPYFNNGGSYN
ncbi:hypothetical protein ACTA71_001728 [Dictyostelium dimigraforme]